MELFVNISIVLIIRRVELKKNTQTARLRAFTSTWVYLKIKSEIKDINAEKNMFCADLCIFNYASCQSHYPNFRKVSKIAQSNLILHSIVIRYFSMHQTLVLLMYLRQLACLPPINYLSLKIHTQKTSVKSGTI